MTELSKWIRPPPPPYERIRAIYLKNHRHLKGAFVKELTELYPSCTIEKARDTFDFLKLERADLERMIMKNLGCGA